MSKWTDAISFEENEIKEYKIMLALAIDEQLEQREHDVRIIISQIDTALEALRYMEAQEKGCEYCNGEDMSSKALQEADEGHAHTLIIDSSFIYSYCVCGRHMVTEIRRCTNCGRKLE